MLRYFLIVSLAAAGVCLLAGGAVLLWLNPGAGAAGVTIGGALCYCGAMLLISRSSRL